MQYDQGHFQSVVIESCSSACQRTSRVSDNVFDLMEASQLITLNENPFFSIFELYVHGTYLYTN